MIFRGIKYALSQALHQIVRNRAMSVASIFSITCMLLILGLFFIMAVNVNLMTENAKRQFDTIQVYLLDDTTEEAANKMIESLDALPQVAKTTYVSSEEALNEFRARWGENSYLLDTLPANPLPNSIRVELHNLEDANLVAAAAEKLPGVEEARSYETEIAQVLKVTNAIQTGALVVIAFLIIVSVVVVANTVKLTVLAREREIGIMKYVGATNWFIRGPFLAEGMLIGCISALVSVGLVSFIYYKISDLMGMQIMLLTTALVPLDFLAKNLVWIFLALGVSIGAFGSIVSMRRFLDT